MREGAQNNDQQRLSEFQRQRAHCSRYANPAGRRSASSILRVLVPPRFTIVEGQAANMSAIKSNKLAKSMHARVFAKPADCLRWSSGVDRFYRSPPEQSFDKRSRSRMVEHESIVSRQRQPESAQVRDVGETVAQRGRL